VPLETPLGSHGFLGLVLARPRIFTREHRIVLQSIASRLGNELGWRAVHQRTADELDRVINGPGLDQLLGIWNRTAIAQLATMHVSSSHRSGLPLTAVLIDILDLREINTRHGLGIGDRVLCRVADAIRAHPEYVSGTTRDELKLLGAIPGAIGKAGAEACYAVALADGRAYALKIDDGGARARPVVMAEALRRAGLPTEAGVDAAALDDTGRVPVLGAGEPVGEIRAAF